MFIILTNTALSLNCLMSLNRLSIPCIIILIQQTVPLAPHRGFPVYPWVTLEAAQVC